MLGDCIHNDDLEHIGWADRVGKQLTVTGAAGTVRLLRIDWAKVEARDAAWAQERIAAGKASRGKSAAA
jgi:hypothetical protein